MLAAGALILATALRPRDVRAIEGDIAPALSPA
jgi:hypothetical protein